MCTVVATLESRGCTTSTAACPVKNTFIHFDTAAVEGGETSGNKVRFLRRCRTDPQSPPPPAARRPAAPPVAEAPVEAQVGSASTSQCSTPRGSVGEGTPPRGTARAEESSPPGASTPSTLSWPCTPPGSPEVGCLVGKASLPGFLLPVPAFPAALAPPAAEGLEQAVFTPAAAPATPPRRRPGTAISLAEASSPLRGASPPKAIALAEAIGPAKEIPDREAPAEPPSCRRGEAAPEWAPERTPEPPAPWWSATHANPTPAPAPAPAPAPNSVGSPFLQFKDGGFLFGFQLRRADNVGLGLILARSDKGRSLLVQSVLAGGAVEAWNRQVVGSAANNGKAIVPGDKIVCVNAVYGDCDAMAAECKEKQLLKFLVARGGLRCDDLLSRLADGLGPSAAGPWPGSGDERLLASPGERPPAVVAL